MSNMVSRAVIVLLGLGISTAASAAPGDVDSTWGSSGVVGVNYGDAGFNGGTSYNNTVTDNGGRHYVVGTTVVGGIRRPIITAFHDNGTIDTTFGTSGHKIDMGLPASVQPYAAAAMTVETKIVAKYGWEWTYYYVTYAVSTSSAMYVYKVPVYTEYEQYLENPTWETWHENGSTPSTWGDGTRAVVSFPGGVGHSHLDIEASGTASGTLLVGTARSVAGGQRKGVAVRLSKLGSLVTTFGTSGIQWVQTGSTDMLAAVENECAVGRAQTSPSPTEVLVACFTTTGLNTAFDADGWKRFSLGDATNPNSLGRSLYRVNGGALTIAANVCTSSGDGCKIGLARLTSTGAFDTTFSGDGKALYSAGGTGGTIGGSELVLFGSRFMIFGQQANGTAMHSMMFAFTSAGAADTTFGTGGVRAYGLSNGLEGYGAAWYAYTAGALVAVGNRDVFAPDGVQGLLVKHNGF